MSQSPVLFRLWRSLPVRIGLVLLLLLVLAIRLLMASGVRRSAQTTSVRPSGPSHQVAPLKTVKQEYSSPVARFTPPPSRPENNTSAGPPPLPEEVKKTLLSDPGPISLFASSPPPAADTPAIEPPMRYLPSFRLIRCMLVTAPQTGDIESPLIGVVLDDQYNTDANGHPHLVVPAGVEVHSMGRPSPVRDRIDGDGDWTFVWRTVDEDNALELRVPALALNRDYDSGLGLYGDEEKSPGIRGRRFQSYSETVIKEALLEATAATIRTLKTTQAQTNPLTNTTNYQQKPGQKNALIEGAAAGVDRVTQMLDDIRQQIEQKGYYVAVLPGKEFYLYNKVPIDLRVAHRPGATQAPPPHDLIQQTLAPLEQKNLTPNPATP
jgi:hypothetical protein